MSDTQDRAVHVDYYDHWKYEWHAREKHMPKDSPPYRYNVYISTDGDLPEHPDWDVEQLASRNGYEGLFLTDEPIDTKDKALAFFKKHGHKTLGTEVTVTIREHEATDDLPKYAPDFIYMQTEEERDKRWGYRFEFPLVEFCKLILECHEQDTQEAAD